jgi:hypothetical protein
VLQRLNFTGRIDLSNNEVSANFVNSDNSQKILLAWNFSKFNFSKSCELVVDLRSTGTTETSRITIGRLEENVNEYEIDISQMRNPDLVRVRLKVCEKDYNGLSRIKAQIDNLIPKPLEADDNARSFLKLAKDDDLEVPWELRFDSGEPCLFITGKKDLYHQLRNRSPWFLPLIMHDVVRQIFLWLADQSDYENYDIAEQWKQFFFDMGCPVDFFNSVDEIDSDERSEEVDSQLRLILQSFVKQHNILNELSNLVSFEGE